MKKLLLMISVLIVLSGCAKTKSDTLTIGYTNFPPLGYRDESGQAVGFDIDLARAVAHEMEITIEFQYINWDTKILELNSGNIDAIWNGFSITPSRQKEVLFTQPYIDNAIVLITNKDNTTLQSLDDLSTVAIGVESESSGYHTLESLFDINTLDIRRFTSINEALLDLKAQSIDVVVTDAIYANYVMNQSDDYRIVEGIKLTAEQYGIGLRMGDTELQTSLNTAIETLRQNGTLRDLSIKWFGEDLSL
ncbi:amino acid ABC transporter substrate-binding protein [Erysipelothrix anatis]|uniref:amino acid ABC transporter substrate-binding protein n=1 Tax=Erysipelothrix anatis TaxID=2683713 RepID=UPI001357AF99|nr:amino acid ABC transporter substrate-binding protein [Erysipelothrix anatis]